jgi:hypothetical protein
MIFEKPVACGPFLKGAFNRTLPTRETKSVYRVEHTLLQNLQSHSPALDVSCID